MRSPSVIYLITRTHGRRTHLLTSENLKAISKSRSLPEVVDQLLRSDYASEIGKLPTEEVDSVRLEKIFHRTLVERFLQPVKDTKGKAGEFLEAYAARIEVENLKRILRAKHSQEKIEEENLIPLGREHTILNFPALVKVENVEEAVALLRETAYAAISGRLDDYRRVGLPVVLESYLDDVYFTRLWETLKDLPDSNGLRWLVGEEVDLHNLQLVLSLKMRDLGSRLIEEIIIPVFYRLSKSTLRDLIQSGLDGAPEALAGTSYDDVAEQLLKSKEPSIDLEITLSRRLYQDASFALNQLFLELGYVVAYMLLCEREARDLVTIATALDLGISEEALQRRLLL